MDSFSYISSILVKYCALGSRGDNLQYSLHLCIYTYMVNVICQRQNITALLSHSLWPTFGLVEDFVAVGSSGESIFGLRRLFNGVFPGCESFSGLLYFFTAGDSEASAVSKSYTLLFSLCAGLGEVDDSSALELDLFMFNTFPTFFTAPDTTPGSLLLLVVGVVVF